MDILYRKILRIFTAALLVLSCIFANGVVLSAEKPDKNNNAQLTNKSEYAQYLLKYSEIPTSDKDIVCQLNDAVLDTNTLNFQVDSPKDGLYALGMSYKSLDDKTSKISISLTIDNVYPYPEAESYQFPLMWQDDKSFNNTDEFGNQYAAQQIKYDGFAYNAAIDSSITDGDYYLVYLSKGTHNITLKSNNSKIAVKYFKFAAVSGAEKYTPPKSGIYKGTPIVLEGESAKVKSDYFLVGKSDTSSVDISPHDPKKKCINYIGGGNWKTVGESLIWETPEVEAGYYSLGFSFRQNGTVGSKSYRTLTVDGVVPFAEAEAVGFDYGDGWQQQIFSDENSNPYYIYLSEGKHEIGLRVTSGNVAELRRMLSSAISQMGDLYLDIIKITGEKVDISRDYNLFKQIANMESRLENIKSLLNRSADELQKITGEKSGSNYSIIKNMVMIIEKMLSERSYAHRYKDSFYKNFCSVSSLFQDLCLMPLDLDKIVLSSGEEVFEKSGFFDKVLYSAKRFFVSFSEDYNSVSKDDKDDNSLTIWVSWGRDQAQVLNSLITQSFTPKTNIKVNLELVNASVIQGILSGKGPDLILQQPRSLPVNLAMRNVLYDLSEFDDLDSVLKRFAPGADLPYRYKNELYALPDTQTFFMMFYRKDIFEKYGLKVPETWDEFDLVSRLLTINNMSIYLPNTAATNVAQANAGLGSNNIYPSLLLQNDIEFYTKDGHKTNLLSADAITVFNKWTDYYTKLKFPLTLDFYNRFRIGTTPLGINTYSFYTTLKIAAPEIDGLWGFTEIPGTPKSDGSINHTSSGGGTGCAIMKHSKNPKSAWEFLKWWTDTETQLKYSNNVEAILGPLGRITSSNVEAVKSLDWDDGVEENLINAWKNVKEIPEYPGSYYVSRSLYQAFWNVVERNKNTKDMLMKYGKEADDEIIRKWNQYSNR